MRERGRRSDVFWARSIQTLNSTRSHSRTLTVQPHSQAEQCAKCCLSVLVLILITSCLHRKYMYQALPAIHISVPGEPGNEASETLSQHPLVPACTDH